MKKLLLLLFVIASALQSNAQRTANLALSGGVVNYVGDLGNEKHFPFSSINTGSSITIRDFINNPHRSGTRFPTIDMQLRFSWHRLQYDEVEQVKGKRGTELRNYLRGIGFRNDLFGSEVDFTYNMYTNRYASSAKPRFNFFLLAGVGMFYGQPKADLFHGDASPSTRYYYWKDGSVRNADESTGKGEIIGKDGNYETTLHDWKTEGQGFSKESKSNPPYSNWNVGFPVGGGIRYIPNQLFTFSAEFNYYYFLTDYLDDVSSRYASYEELQNSFPNPNLFEMAKYISDPTGMGTQGDPVTASPRGNPDQKDSFTYVSLEMSYKIVWKKRGIY